MVLDVIRALSRRWYVALVGVLLTAAMVTTARSSTPPVYNARGLVVLLPSEAAVGKGGNPFLTLDGLEQPAGLVVAYFSSAPARDQVKKRSATAQYLVGIDDSTRGPVIAIDVTDVSAEKTLDTLNYLTEQISVELKELQSQVEAPQNAVITAMPLTVDKKAAKSTKATLRSMIAALVVGLGVTCVTTFALDGLLLRRQLRRTSAGAGPDDGDDSEGTTPTDGPAEEPKDSPTTEAEDPDAIREGSGGRRRATASDKKPLVSATKNNT